MYSSEKIKSKNNAEIIRQKYEKHSSISLVWIVQMA